MFCILGIKSKSHFELENLIDVNVPIVGNRSEADEDELAKGDRGD